MIPRPKLIFLALFGIALAQADQFQFSMYGIGPIVMDSKIECKGRKAHLTASARNDSGGPIEYADWCVQSVAKKGCAFKLWTTATWLSGETITWDLTGRLVKGFPAHFVTLNELNISPETAERRRQAVLRAEEERAASRRRELEEQAANARRQFEEWKKRAEAGEVEAQYRVADAYAHGIGAPTDAVEAARWYRKAADQDDPRAELALGTLYLIGNGVQFSSTEAVSLIDTAAGQGYPLAQYWLARLYFSGVGVPQDFMAAHMWANLAASFGVKEAPELREAVAGRLAPEQLIAAQALAKAWEPRGTAKPGSRIGGQQLQATGSGFGISRDGYVVTNHHVVDGCSTVQIVTEGARTIASVVATDAKNDLAVLKSDRTFDSPARIRIAATKVGEPVWAAGFPLSDILASAMSVTPGGVSSETGLKNDTTQIQFTAPVQHGNSGGPLLGKDGSVVGVVDATLDDEFVIRVSGSIPQNVNFAIKSSVLRDFLDSSRVSYAPAVPGEQILDPTVLSDQARRFTVLLECWK